MLMLNKLKSWLSMTDKALHPFLDRVERVRRYQEEYKTLSEDAFVIVAQGLKIFEDETERDERVLALLANVFKQQLSIELHDEQLLGALVMRSRSIAEMATGEGKTFSLVGAAVMHAFSGKKVHIFTANEYLAKRDAEWVKVVYEQFDLTSAYLSSDMKVAQRVDVYASDIIYGAGSEFAFDSLRTQLVRDKEHAYFTAQGVVALVDEADTILIDMARNPVSISEPMPSITGIVPFFDEFQAELEEGTHFEVDKAELQVHLTEQGVAYVEERLNIENLYDTDQIIGLLKLQYALIAHRLTKKDVEYVVEDGRLTPIDMATGRRMVGRLFSDGIQQAIEQKENLPLSPEMQVKAIVTYQNFLSEYENMAGATGSAKTEEAELEEVYGLEVITIPTHHSVIREDFPTQIYKTQAAKMDYVVGEILRMHEHGRPVLVGAANTHEVEVLANRLLELDMHFERIDARNHARESEIIAKAGERGSITLSTNMAGRGTDIVLGEGVREIGGLHVIGTTVHPNRRIDNQLRGRAGRQGDPGSSIFVVSLEDELLQRFGGDSIRELLNRFRLADDMAIQNKMVSDLVTKMQLQSELSDHDSRKQTQQKDQVLHDQRLALYQSRQNVLNQPYTRLKEQVFNYYDKSVAYWIDKHSDEDELTKLDEILDEASENIFTLLDREVRMRLSLITDREILHSTLLGLMKNSFEEAENLIGEDELEKIVRGTILKIMDSAWIDHLNNLEMMRKSFAVRPALSNPLLDYSMGAAEYFDELVLKIQVNIVKVLANMRLSVVED